MTDLSLKDQARAMLESRIEILIDEAVATSAIKGITLDRPEVRRTVLRRLAPQERQER
jgi:hypothetical protein